MVFCFSSKNKWNDKKSCFEYVLIFHDLTNDNFLVVMDSDMEEFRKEYENELKDELFVNVNDEFGEI